MKIPSFTGTTRQAGALYAGHYLREISGFYTQEFGSYQNSRKYVTACLRCMERDTPVASTFFHGMAQGARDDARSYSVIIQRQGHTQLRDEVSRY